MYSVLRSFIKGYAEIALPSSRKASKDFPKTWENLSEEEMAAFGFLKRAHLTAPILAFPEDGYLNTLDTDTLACQIGFCLLQEKPDGHLLPVYTVVDHSLRGKESFLPQRRTV